MDEICKGSVALVGNGPISEEDRAKIESFDCVVRFNDMKNKRPGERSDVHVSRYLKDKDRFPGMEKNEGEFVVPVTISERHVHRAPELRDKKLLPTLLVYETLHNGKNDVGSEARIFENCSSCKESCLHSQRPCGPSTGTAVIDHLEKSHAVVSIDTFGMNWNGTDCHIDFKHSDTVPTCCSKCNIHATPRTSYRP